jgi:hypothetical protein
MSKSSDTSVPKDASRGSTVWQKYVQECLELSNTVLRAGARVGTACVESSAELCRGEAQVMGQYMTQVGETLARAMGSATTAATGSLPPMEMGLELGRAYINACIQSAEAVRGAARRFVDLGLVDKPA